MAQKAEKVLPPRNDPHLCQPPLDLNDVRMPCRVQLHRIEPLAKAQTLFVSHELA
eukprot:CAMPEP_0172787992 /NCGR_PEP_ID=MMETSP1074-20121228/206725_1 /TAXON_ID=2916 /ORGANISM="Ceratium fusus, Strain PA161109" /LENGTH=54 /DNA_ID=CAMNT_0013625013 /DNA_START=873 /DNA_END=1037 /DNA_ORIENTATION=-